MWAMPTVKLVCPCLILQVRESASSRPIMTFTSCSSRWISPRLVALIANCDYVLKTYLHRRTFKKHFGIFVMTLRSTCHLLLCRRLPISYKIRDPKCIGRLHLLVLSPVIPGVTTILFSPLDSMSFFTLPFHLCVGLPLFFLPSGWQLFSFSQVVIFSFLCTWQYQWSRPSLNSSSIPSNPGSCRTS